MTSPDNLQSTIMIVDDNPANLKLLEEMLEARDYQILAFSRGRQALAAATHAPPDLILLDINMPEMDGYEVCSQLKSDSKLADIPILFISARNETMDKVKAFSLGAVDYITKPFQLEEVRARVQTHLGLRRLQKDLKEHNEHLDELVRQRTRQLAEAHDRLAILDKAKSDFLGLISHELRTPLNGLFGVGELLIAECPSTPATTELAAMFQQSQRRLHTIIEDALVLTRIKVSGEQFPLDLVPLSTVLSNATENARCFAKGRNVFLGSVPEDLRLVCGETGLLSKAIQVLLETAVKFSNPGGSVNLACQSAGADVVLQIDVVGCTIPDDALPKFFQVFAIGEPITPGGDLGLGPPVAERIISLFGGAVTVENLDPPGICIKVRLKASESQVQA